jgi:hypothetical protein
MNKLNLVYEANYQIRIDLREIIIWMRDNLEFDHMVKFIIELEKSTESLDMVEPLYEHFSKLHQEYIEEFEVKQND